MDNNRSSVVPQINSDRAAPNEAGPADPLRGRGLRFVLVNEMMKRPSMTVAEMAKTLAGYGFDLGGRASKVISDGLRWEVRSGRVLRLARGVYRYHRAPPSTARRITLFAELCLRWIVAARRREPVPPIPRDRRCPPGRLTFHDVIPNAPPWIQLSWLWST